MVIPDWNPREGSVTQLQVQIATVSGVALTVVVQSVDDSFRLGHATNGLSVSVISVTRVLIDIVSKVNDVIHAILSRRIAVCVEEAEWVVAAAVDSKSHIRNVVVNSRSGLCPAKWTLLIAVANRELVVVSCERLETLRFNLNSVVNVAAGVCTAFAADVLEAFRLRDLVVHAHGSSRDGEVGSVVVQGHGTANGRVVVHSGILRRDARPQNDRVRVRIARRNAMCEVQLRSGELARRVALVDLMKRDTKTRVMLRRRAVVKVACPACRSNGGV